MSAAARVKAWADGTAEGLDPADVLAVLAEREELRKLLAAIVPAYKADEVTIAAEWGRGEGWPELARKFPDDEGYAAIARADELLATD